MAMQLEKVVPFGRSLAEYTAMFALTPSDLAQRIVAVADGPASFNAELTALGRPVVSVDPLYVFGAEAIQRQFDAVVDNIIAQVKATPDDWVWSFHASPEDLKANRMAVLRRFLADFESGKTEGRYRIGELPRLDFAAGEFDLAVCSHFLFLYADHFSEDFHRESVLELLRIAREVRIFPLLTLARRIPACLQPLIAELRQLGYSVDIESVAYELQRGGNQMLRIRHRP